MAIYPTLFVTYLEHFQGWGPALMTGHRELLVELAVVAIATLWNLRGAVAVGEGSVVMWMVGLAPFFVLIGAAFWRGLHAPSATLASPHGHADLAAGMLVALWNYMGWDNASTIAGEVEDPQRTYPRVMLIAALMTMATYLLPVTAVWFAGIAPGQFSTGAWVDAAQNLVGYPLALTLTLVASLDSLGNFNSLTLSYTRLPFAMACDGLLPRVLTRKLANGVPWVSLLLCAVGWSLALGLKFDRLITVDISLWGLSVVLEFIALVVLRITEPEMPRPFRVPGPTWVAVALGAGPAVLVVFALWVARAEKVGPFPAALFSLGIAACGVPLYALARWRLERRKLSASTR
jgi:amino acid transporter